MTDLENSQPLYIVKNEKAGPKRTLRVGPRNQPFNKETSRDLPISTAVRSSYLRQGNNDNEGNLPLPPQAQHARALRGRVASQEGSPVPVGPQYTLPV